MKNTLRIFVQITVASSIVMSSGCGIHEIARHTGGMQYSQTLLESGDKVKKGMTMADVRRIVGKPAGISETNGIQKWIYLGNNVFTASSFRKTESASVSIIFDSSGRVAKVNKNRSEQGPILMGGSM